MRLLLGLDLETTSAEPKTCQVLEVGMVLWDAENRQPVSIVDKLVRHPEIVVPTEITELTGIQPEYIEMVGVGPKPILDHVVFLMNHAEAVVAHNGEKFDRLVLARFAEENGVILPEKLWVDTSTDIEYPPQVKTRKLSYLAAEHGFLLDRSQAHRAVFDVLATLRILAQYDLDDVLAVSRTPLITILADVSYDTKDLAKERGYYWDAELRRWRKQIRLARLEQEKAAAPFKVLVCEG